jgi:hypothetical protein
MIGGLEILCNRESSQNLLFEPLVWRESGHSLEAKGIRPAAASAGGDRRPRSARQSLLYLPGAQEYPAHRSLYRVGT